MMLWTRIYSTKSKDFMILTKTRIPLEYIAHRFPTGEIPTVCYAIRLQLILSTFPDAYEWRDTKQLKVPRAEYYLALLHFD